MKIIYVHHRNRKLGNPPTQNDDLTEIGYKDCEIVADLFNNDKVKLSTKAIYTSPYYRCKKTAQIINKHLNVPIIEDDRLNEWNGETENWIDVQNRMDSCINDILKKYEHNDMIICVTSGVNIAGFINKAYKLSPSNDAPKLGVPNCCPIIFDYE